MTLETILTIAGAVGIAKLLEIIVKQFIRSRAKRSASLDQTMTAEIDADKTAFTHYHERIVKLENEMAEMHKMLGDHRVENAKLIEQNKSMQKDNDSQTREIDRLREKVGKLENILKDRDTQLLELKGALDIAKDRENMLTSELQHTTRELHELKVRFDALLGTDEGRKVVREAKQAAMQRDNESI